MKLTNQMRDGFIARVMQDVPSVDYDTLVHDKANAAAVAMLPPLVRAAYDAHPEFIETKSRRAGNTWLYMVGTEQLPPKVDEEIKALQAAALAQSNARRDLQAKLRGVASAATTVKKLRELLPEFEKYMPTEEEQTVNLPAVANVLADFISAGWPKGSEVAA